MKWFVSLERAVLRGFSKLSLPNEADDKPLAVTQSRISAMANIGKPVRKVLEAGHRRKDDD
jgi:hypothetical protein